MKCEITRLALITGAVLLGAAEASRGWETVLPVTGLDHVQPPVSGPARPSTSTGRPVRRYAGQLFRPADEHERRHPGHGS
jgi:hypothetical protein